jgi:hypothetical protein
VKRNPGKIPRGLHGFSNDQDTGSRGRRYDPERTKPDRKFPFRMQVAMKVPHWEFFLSIILFSSCSGTAQVRSADMQKESPEIAAWVTKVQAEVIGILPVNPPSRINQEELPAVAKVVKKYPNTFSAAHTALEKLSDDMWYESVLIGDHVAQTSLNYFSGSDSAKLSSLMKSGKVVKAWAVMLQRSDNFFGDTDRLLVVISSGGAPVAYGYFGVNAGAPDAMCATGVYIPMDRIAPEKTAAKNLDDLPVPRSGKK